MSRTNLSSFTDVFGDEIPDSQPLSLPSSVSPNHITNDSASENKSQKKPAKRTGEIGNFRSVEEIDTKYRTVFTYPFFNLVQSSVIEDALYSDKSMVVCAPTGSGKTVIFEMAIVQLLVEMEDNKCDGDFKIIYMAPVKALCTERLTEWYSKFMNLGLLCIEVTGDTNVDLNQLHAYKIIITTPEKWDMLTRRWRDHRGLVEMIKLFLIDEVHILNDEVRGPVLEAVVSRMKTIELSAQSAHRIEKLKKQYQNIDDLSNPLSPMNDNSPPRIRFVAVSATVGNPEDVALWLGSEGKPAVFYKFGDECRPVKLKKVVEGYPCQDGTSIFKFDIILSYKLWPIIQKYYDGKPTLIFCNTRKSVVLTAETLSREITITFSPGQKAKLTTLASTIKNKKLQMLVLSGVGCHHAGLLYEERVNIENAFRNRDLPILITTTTLAMGVNLPAHLVIIKNTQQYVNGAYQEYSISTVLQMVGRAGRPQFDTEATAVIMTRLRDKARYQALIGGSEPLQSYLHKRLPENLNSEAALGTVADVAQCVQWLRLTFLYVRAARDPKRYLGLPSAAPAHQISKKIEEMCVRAMNGLVSAGLITMDEASCIEATEAGRLMSFYYLDLETMRLLMKIQGDESLERMLTIICECHELADMHLRVDERRCLNALNRNNTSATIRFPMKGKINSRQMKLSCIIQAILGCLPISDPSLNQEAMKVMRIAERICKCLVAYVTRPELISQQQKFYSAILNSILLAKCTVAHLWENSPCVSRQLRGIGPTFSTLLATAGKVNFILIEESHPRDLERIMNKGPPAGNLLRKQVSLLPKYQLTATPIDEKTVSVELMLLNQAFLSENMENLTAGTTHKSYVIAGDSTNHVLLLTTFKDNDLISVFNGTMKFEIIRKHDFEHKIFVKCISSAFVGIDVQCEYTFTSLLRVSNDTNFNTTADPASGNSFVQKYFSTSTSYPKGQKRKMSEEIAQSKEKQKRELAFAEKFRVLKESLNKRSNDIKDDLQKTKDQTELVLNELRDIDSEKHHIEPLLNPNSMNWENAISIDELADFSDGEKINNILNDIENEITKNDNTVKSNIQKKIESKLINYKHNSKKGSNYKFLELLDKNVELSDDDGDANKDDGFSESIKKHVANYMENSRNPPVNLDIALNELCTETDTQYNINKLQSTSKSSFLNEDEEISVHNCDTMIVTNIDKASESNTHKLIGNIIEDENILQKENNPIEILNLKENEKCSLLHHNNFVSNIDEVPEINRRSRYKLVDNITEDENISLSEKNTMKILDSIQRNNDISNDLPDKSNRTHLCSATQNNIINKSGNTLLFNCIDLVTNTKETSEGLPLKKKTNISLDSFKTIDKKMNHQQQTFVLSKNEKINMTEKADSESIPKVSIAEFGRNIQNTLFCDQQDVTVKKNVSSFLDNKTNDIMVDYKQKNSSNSVNQSKLCKNTYDQDLSLSTIPAKKNIAINVNTLIDNDSNYSLEDNIRSVCSYNDSNYEKLSDHLSDSNHVNVVVGEADSRYKRNVSTKKYIFTAEKYDTHLNVSQNFHIHVLKKLKIDLDVTQIICSKSPNKSESDNPVNIKVLNETTNLITKDKNIYNGTNGNNNSYEPNYKDLSMIKCTNNNNILDFNKNENNNCKTHKQTINKNITKTKQIENYSCLKKDSNDASMSEENRRRESQEQRYVEDKSIQKILAKYSTKLRQNKKCNLKTNYQINKIKKNDKIKEESFNYRKPFQITAIDSLNLSLDLLCDPVTPKYGLHNDEGDNQKERDIILTPVAYQSTDHHIQYSIHDNTKICSENENIEDSCTQKSSSLIVHDLTQTDINIDNNMLDPKTLIKCCNADADTHDILPPPLQFSDNICNTSYSPTASASDTYINSSNQGSQLPRIDSFDKLNVDSTPSKETETWIVSDEVNYEHNFVIEAKKSPPRSIINYHYDNNFNLPATIFSRRRLLSQFKFNSKDKFRL